MFKKFKEVIYVPFFFSERSIHVIFIRFAEAAMKFRSVEGEEGGVRE